MSHKIRLGPIAVFLAVVAVVLTTLAILTTATSNADRLMAERFARVTQIRYELEDEGNQYLMEVDEQAKKGRVAVASVDEELTDEGMLRKTIEKDGYVLEIEITKPDSAGNYDISKWKITKEWNAENPFGNIWQGGN